MIKKTQVKLFVVSVLAIALALSFGACSKQTQNDIVADFHNLVEEAKSSVQGIKKEADLLTSGNKVEIAEGLLNLETHLNTAKENLQSDEEDLKKLSHEALLKAEDELNALKEKLPDLEKEGSEELKNALTKLEGEIGKLKDHLTK